jgi:hypothetical protein
MRCSRARRLFGRKPCEKLLGQATKFGPDMTTSVNETYVNLVRGKKKFAILQPSSVERLDIGVKLKGVRPEGRFEAAGSWNTMVTNRIRIGDPAEINAEVLSWLKNAYDASLELHRLVPPRPAGSAADRVPGRRAVLGTRLYSIRRVARTRICRNGPIPPTLGAQTGVLPWSTLSLTRRTLSSCR